MIDGEHRSKFPTLTNIPQGIVIIIAGFLPVFAIVSMFPAVPAMIDHFRNDPSATWKVPALVSAPGLSVALFALFAGLLIDRVGRRRLLLIATIAFGLLGAAPSLLNDLNAIYVTRLFLGIAEAMMLTTVNTLIGDYWADAMRRRWLALQGMIGPFLSALVILASGYVAEWRWNGIFLIYLVSIPVLLAMVKFIYEPDKSKSETTQVDDSGDEKPSFPIYLKAQIVVLTVLASILFYAFIINGALAFREVGIQSSAELGKLMAFPSLLIVLGAALFWLVGSWEARFQFALCFGITGLGLVSIGLAPDWRWMVGGLMIQQLGAGMLVPTLLAWAQKILPFDHRGRGMGIWFASFYVGQFSSPFLITWLREFFPTMQAALIIVGVFGIGGALASLMLLRASRNDV